jgi:hypothetical protein
LKLIEPGEAGEAENVMLAGQRRWPGVVVNVILCAFIDCTFTDRFWRMPKVSTLIGIVDPTVIPLDGENSTLSRPPSLE